MSDIKRIHRALCNAQHSLERYIATGNTDWLNSYLTWNFLARAFSEIWGTEHE